MACVLPFYIDDGLTLVVVAKGDMEGHIGTDGRFYVIDTARLFPPEPPSRKFDILWLSED